MSGFVTRSDGSVIEDGFVWARYKVDLDGTSGLGEAGTSFESLEIPTDTVLINYMICAEGLTSATSTAEIGVRQEGQTSSTDLQTMLDPTGITDIEGFNGTALAAPQVKLDEPIKVIVDFTEEDITAGTLWIFALWHRLA